MFDVFYNEDIREAAKKAKTKFFWLLDDANDYSDFDFNWVPDKWEEHQCHIFPSQWARNSGTYFVNKYTIDEVLNFRHEQKVLRATSKVNWSIPAGIEAKSVDFSWHPDPRDPPYDYQFPSKYQRASGVEYCVPGAIGTKFINPFIIDQSMCMDNWEYADSIDLSSIDFTWRPDPFSMPYIYHFPTKFQRASGVIYRIPGATEIKYVDPFIIKHYSSKYNWIIPDDIDRRTVDFTWRPNPLDPPYIYQFPTKYNNASGVEYHVPNATEHKFIDDFQVSYKSNRKGWIVPEDIDESTIDFTWRPDSMDANYAYHFPTKFQRASGVQFSLSPDAKEIKYSDSFIVKHLTNKEYWVIPDNILNPNLTWRPNPLDPPYIYKFPTEYVRESGLEYHTPGATEEKFVDDISVSFDAEAIPRYYIETTIEALIADHKDEIFWALNEEMDYDEFDFSWQPDSSQRDYLYVFGSQWQKHSQTFYVDGHVVPAVGYTYKFVEELAVRANSNIDIFYIDKSNPGSIDRYEELSSRYENIIKVRYAKSMFATIQRCSSRVKKSKFWIISSENDYSDFNFDWHAEPWQNYMFHVFGSKEQKWSDTYLINKYIFDDHCRWCTDIKDMPDLNFVSDQVIKAINVNDIYLIEHNKLKTVQHNKLKTTRFVDSYLSVIKRITAHSTSEYIWITSDICDYTDFNFDWRPEPYQATMLHVFGPGNNKFGDTFLIHVPTFKEQSAKLELLDWYETVNYCDEQIVPRLPYDMVPYTGDDLTQTIRQHRFESPYALFYPESTDITSIDYNPSVWRLEDRAIHTFTESGSIVLAPKDTIQYLDTQCYDYPQIKRQKDHFLDEKPLDIIFISNGESTADKMYEHLLSITEHDKSLTVKRSDGVNGRAAAYHAASEMSDTDWSFNVFAKLEMDPDFDFHWQPDRLQEPKHYIFHAKNPINGLEYGHQGCIAYNKKLVLDTHEWGLDFTLSRAHEVIPVLSGIACYDTDAWIVWRTAFRECLKLLADDSKESQIRMNAWLVGNNGEHGDVSVAAANDAVKYFKDVNGDHDKLLLTFEWDWLKEYHAKLYD